MSLHFPIPTLFSSSEEQKLAEAIRMNDTCNLSIRNRIISAMTFPLYWIATSIENLAWRLVDPNWKAFVVKGQGHFVTSNYQGTFSSALAKMDQIFTFYITSNTNVKEWHLVHKNKRSNDNQSQLWLQFSQQYGGTCFGNCIALAYTMMKANRLLTIDELKKIEKTDILVTTSQAVQLVANLAIEYNKIIVSNGLAELQKTTTLKDKLSLLGLTVEEYEKHDSKDKINLLMKNSITKNNLDMPIEKLNRLSVLSFTFKLSSLKQKALQNHMIKPGLELIKPFNLLPLEDSNKVVTLQVANFKKTLNKECSSLAAADFKGILLMSGIPIEGRNGHAMLLEVDHKKTIYIFYDNNRGYYQWNDWQSCLAGVETLLKKEKYGSCELILHKLV